jgi:hypothetical protein
MKRFLGLCLVASLVATPILLGVTVLADEGDGNAAILGGAKKGDTNGDEAKKDEAKKPTETPLALIIRELKALVAREKAKPEFDKELVKDLDRLVRTFEKMNKPVKLEDLSSEDRKKLEDQVKEEMARERAAGGGGGGGPPGGGDWASRWSNRVKEKALEDVQLSDKQAEKVNELLDNYLEENRVALQERDRGLQRDLKNDLEKDLRKVVGNKKAKDILNNINKQSGWGGWGGFGGR